MQPIRIVGVTQIRMTTVNESCRDQVALDLQRDEKDWPDETTVYVHKSASIEIVGPGIVDITYMQQGTK